MNNITLTALDVLFHWMVIYYKKIDKTEKTGHPEYSAIIAMAMLFYMNIISISILLDVKLIESITQILFIYSISILILYLFFIRSKRHLKIALLYKKRGVSKYDNIEKAIVFIYIGLSMITLFL